MQALVFDTEKGSWDETVGFDKETVPAPTLDEKNNPKDAESIILRVNYAGVCGSDKGIWYRRSFKEQILNSLAAEGKKRRIIGHEFFGEITDVGSQAKKTGAGAMIRVGDFATTESHLVCNACFQCLAGERHVCTKEKIFGISEDGGFAEFVKVPAFTLWPTDTAKIRPEIGAVQEPFGNAVHAASIVPLTGKTIAIFGLGPIGLFLLLVARGMGAKTIIGVEPNPISQDMAKRLGIDYVIPLPKRDTPSSKHDEEVAENILEFTNGLGADVSFEMAGTNDSLNNAIFSTRRGGDVIGFGIKNEDFVIENYNRFIVRGQTLHAVIGRRLFGTWEMTRRLLEDPRNGIQENIWNIILERGKDVILPLNSYNKAVFEEKLAKHPKILLQM